MKLESQVCTLAQAKKLKELGVTGSSFLYWVEVKERPAQLMMKVNFDFRIDYVSYHAFTCAELGVMLPENIYVKDNKEDYWLEIHKEDKLIYSAAYRSLDGHCLKFANDSEMTHSVASLLIQVIESGLITVEEINAKL